MASRTVTNDKELEALITLLRQLKQPFTADWAQGRDRTAQQNRLQRQWCNEVAEQLGDRTAEEVRGYCKLALGVPILRAADAEFCEAYDRVVKPLPYEDKLACMMEPIDFPVTRRMKVPQMIAYLDAIQQHWSSQGVRLTDPDPDLAAYQSRYRAPERKAA